MVAGRREREFIKSLEMTTKVHELRIAFTVHFQYNKEDILDKIYDKTRI